MKFINKLLMSFITVTSYSIGLINANETPPNPPSELDFEHTTKTSTVIKWKNNSSDETGFKIYKRLPGNSWSTAPYMVLSEDTISFTDKGLSPNTTYEYMIKSTNDISGVPLQSAEINQNFSIYNYMPPYVVESKINGTNLFLFGTQHDNDVESPTFKTVKYLIDNYDIDFVVLEGTPYTVNIDSAYSGQQDCINQPPLCTTEQFYAYSIAKAKNSGIQFSGGEPDTRDEYSFLVLNGNYTLNDYVGYRYILNAISLNMSNQMSESTLRNHVENTRSWLENVLQVTINFTYDDWINWYKTKMNVSSVDLYEFGQMTIRPYNGDDATFVERMSYAYNLARDHQLTTVINNNLNNFNNILIVYGQGHISTIYRNFTDRTTNTPMLFRWY